VDWAPGEGEGDTIASSADCILVVGANIDRNRFGGKIGEKEGAVKLGASVYR
jgi:hypothetical protein